MRAKMGKNVGCYENDNNFSFISLYIRRLHTLRIFIRFYYMCFTF